MPLKKAALLLCLFSLLLIPLFFFVPPASSDELDDINKQLAELNDALNKSVAATKPLQSELERMQKQIEGIKHQVTAVEADMAIKQKEITSGYKDLAEKEKLVAKAIREFYINSYYDSPLLIFFSQNTASEVTRNLAYQRAKTNQDKAFISNLAYSITSLEQKKAALEQQQKWLVATKSNLDQQSGKLDQVVKGALAYQKEVSAKISDLSAKQQEIINARSGSFTFTIGGGELADEYLSSKQGFSESAPSGYFAIFSFGAYTHRKGMSQYGARGRAATQNYTAILKAYYGKEPVNKDTNGTIKVAGYGEMDFETSYLYGIAEMPSTWPMEALKAQAVAARTYAYRYKQEGSEICTSESCQVFNKSKSDNSPQAWKDAVDQTKGQVLEDVVTYYASTHGGYASPIGWDTTDGSSGSLDKYYEKIGGSPWLYKAWWRKGYSNSGDTCGRANPWLSPQEMADIVNAALALKTGGIDKSRITPITTSCWGGNPYSMDELKNLVSGGISSATSISVAQGNGVTNSVTINGITMSGSEFRNAVMLRAPGYVRIPQGGYDGWAFFNVEKK